MNFLHLAHEVKSLWGARFAGYVLVLFLKALFMSVLFFFVVAHMQDHIFKAWANSTVTDSEKLKLLYQAKLLNEQHPDGLKVM